MKEITTITVSRDTHKQLSLIKIDTNAKKFDTVITWIIEKLKGDLSPVKNQGEDSISKEKGK